MLAKTKKSGIATLLVLACMLTMAVTAFAGNSFTNYNTTVGRINGNGYSGTQVKATSGANGCIKSTSVGGNYTVDVRMQKSDGTANGSWYRALNDNMNTGYNIDGNSSQKAGNNVRLQFSNNLNTLVDVQVIGSWCSQ